MQISFRKIRQQKQPFELAKDGLIFRGQFFRSGKHEVTMEGCIEGEISLQCDRCGETYIQPLDETFKIEVVDHPLKVDESLDVIECIDGVVDFDTICRSEITSIESEYHLCPRCGEDEDFEIEI